MMCWRWLRENRKLPSVMEAANEDYGMGSRCSARLGLLPPAFAFAVEKAAISARTIRVHDIGPI